MCLPLHVDLLLWLAWETRMKEHFETIIFQMSYWHRVNDKGELLGLNGLPLQLRSTWNTDEIMKTISQWRQRGVDYVHRIFHEDITRAMQHSVCERGTCKVSCVETIVHIYNAVGIGSAPMLRVHTGNLADLVRIVIDADDRMMWGSYCDNVANISRDVTEFQLEIENYVRSPVTLAGTNNYRPFRRRVPLSDGRIGRG
ncbi:hypothetical protein CGMCC3_g9652 [Colletotrichum fructicola]|nr:uncharacterized protein CGMCC3_g9652 [Colletotrichum fructicola]KAE9574290.1 hypothetical protein CGMCC3_g9652 [Colletotrichum fructicola]